MSEYFGITMEVGKDNDPCFPKDISLIIFNKMKKIGGYSDVALTRIIEVSQSFPYQLKKGGCRLRKSHIQKFFYLHTDVIPEQLFNGAVICEKKGETSNNEGDSPSDDLNGASDDLNGASDDLNGASIVVREELRESFLTGMQSLSGYHDFIVFLDHFPKEEQLAFLESGIVPNKWTNALKDKKGYSSFIERYKNGNIFELTKPKQKEKTTKAMKEVEIAMKADLPGELVESVVVSSFKGGKTQCLQEGLNTLIGSLVRLLPDYSIKYDATKQIVTITKDGDIYFIKTEKMFP